MRFLVGDRFAQIRAHVYINRVLDVDYTSFVVSGPDVVLLFVGVGRDGVIRG